MKREGFTLIELLVVIAIIALIIAISLPSLENSRKRARTLKCGSNIKQLAVSMAMYELDNGTFPHALDDTLLKLKSPPPGGFAGKPSFNRIGWWWFNKIDYSGKNSDRDPLWCPSREIDDIRLKNNVLCGNYGVNLSICKNTGGRSQSEFVGTPLSSSNIPHPIQSLLIVDSGYSMIGFWHVTDVPPEPLGNSIIEDAAYVPGLKINKEKKLWPGLEWDAITGRHPNKTVNVGFADGHISRTKADDLFVEKTETGYNNRHPLWSPIKTKTPPF